MSRLNTTTDPTRLISTVNYSSLIKLADLIQSGDKICLARQYTCLGVLYRIYVYQIIIPEAKMKRYLIVDASS